MHICSTCTWTAVCALLVGGIALDAAPVPLSHLRVTQQVPTGHDLSELRRLYLLEPGVVAYRVSAMSEAGDNRRPTSFDANPERLLRALDEISRRLEGVPFVEGSREMARLIDSLRYDYYDKPFEFSSLRLDHLDRTSRLADGTPFLRGSRTLLGLLNNERRNYYSRPGGYDDERIAQLNEISLKASSLPFLRGNSDLMARLKFDEMRYGENPETFTAQRLGELNVIAIRVTGQAFIRPRDWTLAIALAAGALFLVGVGFVTLARRRRRKKRRRTTGRSGEMTVHRACLVLGVEPDCSQQELTHAYRSVQKQYHPDLLATMGPEFRQLAEAKTREINKAYEVMKKRAQPSA